MELLQHFSHDHPLMFIQDQNPPASEQKEEQEEARCFGCEEQVEGPSYCCSKGCKFFLHKRCAELELGSEINHPLHPQHPLSLAQASPSSQGVQYFCNFCRKVLSGFVYYCASCQEEIFLDISCAFLEQSIFQNIPKLQHFSHQHPLLFMEKHNKRVNGFCVACNEDLSGAIYRCLDCNYDLHKKCAELPLEINHPLHPPHPLILLSQTPFFEFSPGLRGNICRFCHGFSSALFVYRCASCIFDLDIDCALLQLSIVGGFHKLEHFSHEHPFIFNEKYNKQRNSLCYGCWKRVLGSFYRCVDCFSFDLHKECAELPLEIHHSYHRKHPLTLLPNPPPHPEKCSCYLCQTEYKGFIYYCFLCNFWLNPENISLPRMLTVASHEHPWTLLSVCISFICNFCGTTGDCAPYVCTMCDLLVHKKCISLPQKIKITRHYHPISHTYFLQENKSKKWECRICYNEVNTEYGSYRCTTSDCNYIAHVKCATEGESWDGEAYVLEDEDERARESVSLITHVINEMTIGEDVIATEIKHAYHMHNLTMIFAGDLNDDIICDGCMKSISLPYYSCKKCGFFLHKRCAELPRVKQYVIHKHPLTLKKVDSRFCTACLRLQDGFSYECEEKNCPFMTDIQCSLQPDNLSHPSHEHLLLFIDQRRGNCSNCGDRMRLRFKCKEHCGFYLCFECITLPLTTWHKYDKHPLTLTYHDDSNLIQHYCDICEEKRDPNKWFYYCADCDNSIHIKCVLGDFPFLKLGSVRSSIKHPHPLKIVKKIWDCPPCHACGELCSGKVLECVNADCKQVFHFRCMQY